jgi:hypothetical protein
MIVTPVDYVGVIGASAALQIWWLWKLNWLEPPEDDGDE